MRARSAITFLAIAHILGVDQWTHDLRGFESHTVLYLELRLTDRTTGARTYRASGETDGTNLAYG